MQAVFKGSPNFDTDRKPIDRIVIHWFGEGTLESANTRFQNESSQVSAHYGISDSRLWQWVKEENVAYHAGVYSMNQRSIGIEHDATTTKNASEETYQASIKLVAEICKKYNIPADRTHIIKHSEVKATACCGTLDIDRIVREVSLLLTPVQEINDQTKIDLGVHGVMEVQAIKSKLNDMMRDLEDSHKAIDSLSSQLKGFADKWVQEYKLSTDSGLVQVEIEMARLLPLEDEYEKTIEAIEEIVGHFQDKNSRLTALGAVKQEIKAVSDKLDDCQKKLSTRKILKTITVFGYTFKIYREG